MLKRKKQIIAKVMATTMLATTLATTLPISASALEPRSAAVSSSILAGSNRQATAVKISENGWSSSTHAVIINGYDGLVDALTATPYANLKNAPILVSKKDTLTSETEARLTKLGVKTVDIVGGTTVVSENVVKELKAMNISVNRISGTNRYTTGVAVAEAMDKISDVSKVAVVNGATGLPDAVSVAAPAADNKMPIILSNPNNGLADSKEFINKEDIYKSYVVGQTDVVSDTVMNSLPGTKVRLGGERRQETNAKVISEFYKSTSLDNIYVAKSGQVEKSDELVDALAVGVLAAKNDVPVMIVGKTLDYSQENLLKNKSFSRITQIGDGVPSASIDAIRNTQADPESKVSSVSMVNYKTIKITGSELNRIDASKIYMSGNSVARYTPNSTGTEATVEFNNAFNNGTNTVRITSNLGNSTTHSFTYNSEVSSVQASTKEVGSSGIQYLQFTVNGNQKRTVDELKALGWTVEFKSAKKVFYNQANTSDPKNTSNNGKLITKFNISDIVDSVFDYEVILKKGNTELKSGKTAVTIVNRAVQYKEIKSFDTKLDDVKITSNKLVIDDEISIDNIKGTDIDNNEAVISSYSLTSSNPGVAAISDKKIKAISTGSSEITVTSGNVTKKFSVSVVSEKRKMNSVSLSNSSIKLLTGKDTKIVATVKDQYGDPLKGKELLAQETEILGSDKKPVAKAAKTSVTDKEGKATIEVTAEAALPEKVTTASGTLYIKNEAGTGNAASTSVYVSNDDVEKSWQLNLSDIKKDTTLDMYNRSEDSDVVVNLNKYNSGGYLLGSEGTISTTENSSLWVKSLNNEVATVSTSEGAITIKAGTKPGSTSIKAYSGTKEIANISITVKDTTPKITSIAMNDITTINKDNLVSGVTTFSIEDLINATKIDSKNVVEGISMSGTKDEVLLGTKDGSKLGEKENILFIDNKDKSNGTYDDKELILATIELMNDCGTLSGDGKSVKITQTSSAIKGNIIVKIYHGQHEAQENPFITKVIKVDIPAAN